MKAKNKKTRDWMRDQGEFYHMALFHHHQITSSANGIDNPTDETMITFTYPDGSEYNIRYGVLKMKANEEQIKFINDNKNINPEGAE